MQALVVALPHDSHAEAIDLLADLLSDINTSPPTSFEAEILAEQIRILLDTRMLGRVEERLRLLDIRDPWLARLNEAALAYHRGTPAAGLAAFGPAIVAGGPRPGRLWARAGLVLGKLYTDAGDVDAARLWLLEGMREARSCVDLDLLAACCGALGEVLYLGGQPLPALELFTLDATLLPPGSTHLERLMVYRAHCYRQYNQLAAARGLYEQALQAACLRGHGSGYPLRGLLWCAALELAGGGDEPTLRKEIDRTYEQLTEPGNSLSLGPGLLGRAWVVQRSGHRHAAAAMLQLARESLLAVGMVREGAWCAGLVTGEVPDGPQVPLLVADPGPEPGARSGHRQRLLVRSRLARSPPCQARASPGLHVHDDHRSPQTTAQVRGGGGDARDPVPVIRTGIDLLLGEAGSHVSPHHRLELLARPYHGPGRYLAGPDRANDRRREVGLSDPQTLATAQHQRTDRGPGGDADVGATDERMVVGRHRIKQVRIVGMAQDGHPRDADVRVDIEHEEIAGSR